MRKKLVRNPLAYRKSLEQKSKQLRKQEYSRHRVAAEQFDKAMENIVKYMNSRLKVLPAGSMQTIICELETAAQVTHAIQLRKSDYGSFFALMSAAVDALIEKGEVLLHEDEFGVVLGLPNSWPPEELREESVTVEDLDPSFDWGSILIHKCPHDVRRSLVFEY